MMLRQDLADKLAEAVQHFWATRSRQSARQGTASGNRDQGSRADVTGGAHMDGFVHLIRELLVSSGLPRPSVHFQKQVELPGYYRPEKRWDLLVVVDGCLIAGIEFKSQVGPSFGNNYNNRTEEALGSATDLWAAYREGAFSPSARPWLGYLILLEDDPRSVSPVRVKEPHFPVFDEFRDASYAQRYQILLTKLVRERLYDSACLLLSDRAAGAGGAYSEPSAELSFASFASSLVARALACSAVGGRASPGTLPQDRPGDA